MTTDRKPHSTLAGYVCELKAKLGGHIVVFDRENGADDIDADTRWIVMHMPSSLHVAVHSQAQARDVMKGVARATSIDAACEHADILPRPAELTGAVDDDGADLTVRIQERLRRRRERPAASAVRPRPPSHIALEGRDQIFTRLTPASRMKDHVVHLLPDPEQLGAALCSIDLAHGWRRYCDQHPGKLFDVCGTCFDQGVRRVADELNAQRQQVDQ